MDTNVIKEILSKYKLSNFKDEKITYSFKDDKDFYKDKKIYILNKNT